MKVASKLIETITKSRRLRDKTFFFSTNNPSYIKHADRIIYLDGGSIKFNGRYQDFVESDLYNVYMSLAKKKKVQNSQNSKKLKLFLEQKWSTGV